MKTRTNGDGNLVLEKRTREPFRPWKPWAEGAKAAGMGLLALAGALQAADADANLWHVLIIAVLAALRMGMNCWNNWDRPKKSNGVSGPMAKVLMVCVCLAAAGCASNGSNYRGVTTYYDDQGRVTSIEDITFKGRTTATLGSKATEGSGNMSMTWTDEGGGIAVGNAAAEIDGGELADIIKLIEVLSKIVAPIP